MQKKVLNNRYELEQKIGEGGMARVYRGRDLRLNRRVAIKVLHEHYAADVSFLQRFHHEAQAAAGLRHPCIVNVYDVGQDGDTHYIVMEYVEGSDLKSLILRNGPLPVDQAVAIAEDVAGGLEAAHRLGMVHRDVKPQNILVSPSGRGKNHRLWHCQKFAFDGADRNRYDVWDGGLSVA
jgi:serine/threonine protein kinase